MRKYWIVLFLAVMACLPIWGGRSVNGTSDYLQANAAGSAMWSGAASHIGTIYMAIKFNGANAGLQELFDWPLTHFKSISGAAGTCTGTAACVNVYVTPSSGGIFTNNKIFLDLTQPSTGEIEVTWALPSNGVHTFIFLLDSNTAANNAFYVDGVLQTASVALTGNPGNLYGVGPITLGAGNDTTDVVNFANATFGDAAVWYGYRVNAGEISSLAHCVPPNRINPVGGATYLGLHYWPIYGQDSPEPDYFSNATSSFPPFPMVLNGTTSVHGNQAGCQPGGVYQP
jgi:hypothetical protein